MHVKGVCHVCGVLCGSQCFPCDWFTYVLDILTVIIVCHFDECSVTACQDAYENEAEDAEERVVAVLGEENVHLYPLITKLVIASCQTTKP